MVARRVVISLVGLVVIQASTAWAQTSTANLNVSLTIEGECTIGGGTLAFPTSGVLTSNVDAQSTLTVQCTAGTPYTIELNAGTGTGATPAARLLTGDAGATVPYGIYTDAARSVIWGNAVEGSPLAGTGTGAVDSIPVYGRVPAQASAPAAGTYTDVVTATIIY
ncbi:Spore coat protein U (SCPU) domain-containing protein [Aureimonas altamirensis DSM 21988]|uniref:Spore coat protein U (SCPU) domain-containing protein n=1 Tax=Aureimonas altamirensis DSM 21988 TaxID=1121026 RepID=A0ABY1IMR8_9HYPH|nr:spore coat U domain-containing protein [Aureimonas altamirensis]SHJ49769.1 Spore coat protein U (SCPU) domain-containing protein [Aureimonas altamirensis DSM 21988]